MQDHVNQPRPGATYNNYMPNAKGGGVKRLYKREFLGPADVSGGPESGADRPTTTLG
ncbi:hypothetical protein [Streptomyces goshikiensis]|uniref:hypothetical protein n=1 Tax=Streptomyces goshikiensis TaxID=1942 RepID=UPI0036478D36